MDLWVIPDLNPDGSAAGTRGNAHGVDLNRNFPRRWRASGAPGEAEYAGPRPLSEPESRVAAALIRRLRPSITVWLHQPLDVVDLSGGSRAVERRFARVAGLRARRLVRYPGSATGWQNHVFRGSTAFVVELPPGRVPAGVADRLVRAVRALGDTQAGAPPRFLARRRATPGSWGGRPLGLPRSLRGHQWDRVPTSRHVVALTFDAGGNADGAPLILRILARTRARATFFLTGRWSQTYPALARRIAARYPIGNHTYDHPHLPALSDAAVRREITMAAAVIRRITHHDPRPRFRFPYGSFDSRTLRIVHQEGYGGFLWTVDTLGWMGRSGGQSVQSVRARMLAGLRPGEIVLMHVGSAPDHTSLDAHALAGVIAAIRARGYRLVTLAHLR
jgi:peptidoglycan/xylan/chitin deacetylase (PgdA/CDA1 family)